MAENFKYSSELDEIFKISNFKCASNYKEYNNLAYRWAFEDIKDKRNFLPRATFTDIPNHEQIKNSCGGWSLSLFVTKPQAREALMKQIKKRPNIYKKLGTHIAEGNIDNKDGLFGDHNQETGHFEFMEYQNVDLSLKFRIVEAIAITNS